ncbi:MAG: hypothetical protein ACR2ID_06345 [Chthoniobacterales bacterium]
MQTVPLPPTTTIAKRFPTRLYALLLFLIAAVALAPFASILISDAIAGHYNCTLNEGGAHPCVIGGVDVGETLAVMFVLGWLMFLTVPLGAVAFLIWLVVLVIHRIRWKRRAAAPDRASVA